MPNKDKQNWLQRMIMTGAMAENPAVMTASGYRPDKEKGIIQDKVNDEYVKRLRQNLVGIGAAGAGAMVGAGTLWKVANSPVVSAGFDVATGNYGDAAVGLATDLLPYNKVVKYIPQPVKDRVVKSFYKLREKASGAFNKYVKFARKHYDLPEDIPDDQISDLISGNKYDIENYSEQLNEINIPEIFNEGVLKTPDFAGAESSVYRLGENVVKLSNPASENVIRKDIARVLSRNMLGDYGVKTSFLGVIRDGNNFRAAYRQPFVKPYLGQHFGDLGDLYARLKLKKQGFKTYNISGTSGKAMISPNGIIVDDLKGRNIGVVDGKLVLFDPYHAIHRSNIPNGAKSITDAVSLSGKSIWRDDPSSMVDWYNENPFKKNGGKL